MDTESMSDRDLLVHTAIVCGVLEERTEGLPDMWQRLAKVENDVGWLKKAFWGWAVPGTLSLVGILIKLLR